MKPLNYMTKSKLSTSCDSDGHTVYHAETAQEFLTITCYEILSSWEMTLPLEDPGLIHDGTEDHIQQWLHDHIHTITSLRSLEREYPTENGPVDLLAHDGCDLPVLVEVKRVATTAAIHQVRRYVEGSDVDTGIIICTDMRPAARKRAEKYSIEWIVVKKNDDGYVIEETSENFPYCL